MKNIEKIAEQILDTLESAENKLLLGLGNLRLPKELIPDKMYLGTYAIWYYGWEGIRTPVIKDKGLVTGIKMQFSRNRQNRTDTLYFATTPEQAKVYAYLYPEPMVLKIETRYLDDNKFYYDPGGFIDDDGSTNQIAYRGNIPAHAIKVFGKRTKDKNYER